MTLRELLTSDLDVETLLALVRQGWAWWLDELGSMLPPSWRDRLSSRPRIWIQQRPEGGWSAWREGRLIERVPASARVGLLAPPDMALTRRLSTPRMPARDVRRMMALDIDRLSPLAPDLVFSDSEVAVRDEAAGVQTVLLGLIEREDAADLLNSAQEQGYVPSALAVGSFELGESPRFDFLPQAREAQGGAKPGVSRRYALAAAGMLLLANLAVLIGRDMLEVSRLRDAVEAQRPGVEAVNRLRRRVQREDESRRELVLRGRRSDPLRVIDAVTGALPPPAWVQRLEFNGQKLRIAGYAWQGFDVGGALAATPLFVNLRPVPGTQSAAVGPLRPFDETADLEGAPKS